jgi:hypothetical protein
LQFFRHLKSLATDVPDYFLRIIWTSRLPPHVENILAGQTEGSLDSASNIADSIFDVTPQPTRASVSPAAPDNTTGLLDKIEELTRQVASLQASSSHSRSRDRHSQSRDRQRWQFRDRRRLQTRDRHSNPDAFLAHNDTCWFHSEFGDAARKYRPPCSSQQGNVTGRLRGRLTSAPPAPNGPNIEAALSSGHWVQPVRLPK